MSRVRFGIIACSGVARRRFLPALATSNCAQLVRVGSRDARKAAVLAQQFSCQRHGSYEAVLADPEVDAVYISTPPPLHEEWVLKAAAHHKHVLCEKPAFEDLASARSAVAIFRKHNVRLMEGYAFKFHPQHERVKSLVANGRIGTPRFFLSEFTYPRPGSDDIRLARELNGGVFHDSAGYPVAAALLQMPGQPRSVFCQSGMDPASGVDNAFCAWLHFSDGAMAQLLVAFDAHYRSRYAICGTRGRIELERAFSVSPEMKAMVALETGTDREPISIEPADQFRLMVDHFAAQLRQEIPPRDWEAELLQQHALMDAAARSHHERRIVDLAEYQL